MWKRLGAESMGPKPPALCSIQKSSMSDITSMKGAEKLCRKRIDSTPHQTTNMLSSQKPRKLAHKTAGICAPSPAIPRRSWRQWPGRPARTECQTIRKPPGRAASREYSRPARRSWRARRRGRECRTWRPACAFKSMGTSTIRLPSRMVKSACFQFMPPAISEEASM